MLPNGIGMLARCCAQQPGGRTPPDQTRDATLQHADRGEVQLDGRLGGRRLQKLPFADLRKQALVSEKAKAADDDPDFASYLRWSDRVVVCMRTPSQSRRKTSGTAES